MRDLYCMCGLIKKFMMNILSNVLLLVLCYSLWIMIHNLFIIHERWCLSFSSLYTPMLGCWQLWRGVGAGGGMLEAGLVLEPSLRTSHAPVSILPPTSWQPRIAVLHHITTYTVTRWWGERAVIEVGRVNRVKYDVNRFKSGYLELRRSIEWWTNTNMIWLKYLEQAVNKNIVTLYIEHFHFIYFRYRVSHITGPTLFLLFSRVLEHIQRNFS